MRPVHIIWTPWDAFPSSLKNVGTKCILLVLFEFCIWLLFFFAGMVNGQQVQIVDCIRAFVRIKLMMMMISKFRTAMHQKLPATADVQWGAKAVVTCKIKKVLQNHCIKKS